MSAPLEHSFITHQPPGPLPPQVPMATSNLSIQAQSEESKYQTKYRELRYKVKAIEADNDKLQVKVLNVKKNIQRLRLERAILYERLMSISGANNGPVQGPIPAGAPGIPPVAPAPPASYYQQQPPIPPHSFSSQAPFGNPNLPRAPPAGSHQHHHHGHHHHHHHHSEPARAPPPLPSGGSGMPGIEYSHAGPSGDRYYSNEPRGPSPGANSHHHHNGQSNLRREHRSSGEVTPGRGPPHGGMSIGALEHGMPPPPPTTGHARYSGQRERYGHGGGMEGTSHLGHYASNSVSRTENGEEGHYRRGRSGSRSDRERERERERDREREMPVPAENPNHGEDHGTP